MTSFRYERDNAAVFEMPGLGEYSYTTSHGDLAVVKILV
jgi:hypothetical protein